MGQEKARPPTPVGGGSPWTKPFDPFQKVLAVQTYIYTHDYIILYIYIV